MELIKQSIDYIQSILNEELKIEYAKKLFSITKEKIYIEKEHS